MALLRFLLPRPFAGRGFDGIEYVAAKAFAARQTTEVELKGVGDPHKRSFGSYLRSWLATLRDRAELSPVTINGYERHAEMLMRARHDPARKADGE